MYIQVKDILANPEAFAAAAPAAAAPAAAEPAKKVRMQHNNELLCFCSDPAADKSVKKEVVGTGQGGLPRLCQLQSQGCTAYWVWGFSRGRPWRLHSGGGKDWMLDIPCFIGIQMSLIQYEGYKGWAYSPKIWLIGCWRPPRRSLRRRTWASLCSTRVPPRPLPRDSPPRVWLRADGRILELCA
eukprot:255661-Pelagomonas_calceolata.AAC.3